MIVDRDLLQDLLNWEEIDMKELKSTQATSDTKIESEADDKENHNKHELSQETTQSERKQERLLMRFDRCMKEIENRNQEKVNNL